MYGTVVALSKFLHEIGHAIILLLFKVLFKVPIQNITIHVNPFGDAVIIWSGSHFISTMSIIISFSSLFLPIICGIIATIFILRKKQDSLMEISLLGSYTLIANSVNILALNFSSDGKSIIANGFPVIFLMLISIVLFLWGVGILVQGFIINLKKQILESRKDIFYMLISFLSFPMIGIAHSIAMNSFVARKMFFNFIEVVLILVLTAFGLFVTRNKKVSQISFKLTPERFVFCIFGILMIIAMLIDYARYIA